MPSKHYDLVVIGSGSGLNIASAAANQLGWKVAIIEKGPLGGTCLNRGCIPSKMIIHTADIVETIQSADIFGIKASIQSMDFARIMARANNLVDEDSLRIERNIVKHHSIDLYKTTGFFTTPKTLTVGKEEITGERIVIAAGARPFIPPIEGLEKVDYWTSTEALRQTKLPQSLVIIGGGYISAELGHFYGAMGTKITIIETLPSLLAREDKDIAEAFTLSFSQKYEVILNAKVTHVTQDDTHSKKVTYQDINGHEHTVESEALLVSVGITPNSDTLQLEHTKVTTNPRGYITVNPSMETTEENVWALGDIVGLAPFKHGANYEAEIVFHNMMSKSKRKANYSVMPHAVFTSPQIASVGLTEQQAVEQKIPHEVKKYDYMNTGMGTAIEAHQAFVKFIVDQSEEHILGCHIIGPEASTLIHEVVVAMKAAKGKISAITDTIHIHPSLSEVIQRAL